MLKHVLTHINLRKDNRILGLKVLFNFLKLFFFNCFIYFFSVCFNCLLMDQITKIILVDTLVHHSNSLLIWSSLLPASPPSTKWVAFFFIPPRGEDSLKGHRKLFASLKRFPTV